MTQIFGKNRKNNLMQMSFTLNGYMTVEASFIMPMVICIFAILIYVAFFMYDRCVFNQDVYILSFRESIRKDEDLDRGPSAEKALEGKSRQFGTKYFAVNSSSVEAEVDGKWISVFGNADIFPQVFGNYFLMPKGIWTARFGSKARQSDPPLNIRAFRRRVYLVSEAAQYIKKHQGVE